MSTEEHVMFPARMKTVTPPSPEACGRVWDLEPDCNTVPFFVIVSLLFSCESGKCNNAINQKIAYEK